MEKQLVNERQRELREASKTYERGKSIAVKKVRDKKLRSRLKTLESKYSTSNLRAKNTEILLENEPGFLEPEGTLEKTYKVRQDEIKKHVSVETAEKAFELKLDMGGPYTIDYTRNGRNLLLAGRKGHVATLEWRKGKLSCEANLMDTVRDAKWLHNSLYFATAQAKSVYIYDHQGKTGHLNYMDTSTGQHIIDIHTKAGEPNSMSQNPYSGIINTNHYNGTVSCWSPNSMSPLVKLLAHKGPVRASAVDREGRYMITTGQDCQMSVWDIRTYREVNNWFTRRPATSVAISDTGLVAVGAGTQTTVWRGLFSKAKPDVDQDKVKSPYLNFGGEGRVVERVRWVPFEDLLSVGHDNSVNSWIVPGAGEANPDALETNIFETTKQRQEAEVKALLNKLRPEMISLNPDFVGNLDLASHETRQKEKDLDRKPEAATLKLKNHGRGKNSSLRKYLRKKSKSNIIDEKREQIEALKQQTYERTRNHPQKDPEEELGPALARFARKKA